MLHTFCEENKSIKLQISAKIYKVTFVQRIIEF